MLHPFQMKDCVDKQICGRKSVELVFIYKNFSTILRKREGKDVRWLILATISAIETARESITADYEREFVVFTQNLCLQAICAFC